MAKILIVDDSIVMRKNLATILKAEGHTIVGEASNGRQAITLYEELRPDLCTMDISMPIMSGVEAVAQIVEKDPEAKVIMVSAVNQKKMVFNAINAGAKHYIIKPIVPDKVINVINEVLETKYESMPKVQSQPHVQGFEIVNESGIFIIKFNEHLDFTDMSMLGMAIKGLLFIKPLKVEFNFGDLTGLEANVLSPIGEIIKDIGHNGGEVRFIADDRLLEDLVNMSKEG